MTLKTLALWIGIVAVFAVGPTALNRCLKPDVATQVRPLVAAKWSRDPAMKFARVESVKLEHVGDGEYRGQVEWYIEKYRSTVPISVVAVRGQPLAWKIDAPNDMPLKLEMYGPAQVFYVWPITDAQAGKFAAWVDAEGGIGKEPGSFFLTKSGPAYVYHWAAHDFLVDAAFEADIAERAKRLSAEVFDGSPVEVHLCDQKLCMIKVATSR